MSSKPSLNAADISLISTAIREAYEPILKQEIARAVQEIPFRIREQLEQIMGEEIRDSIRKAVKNQIHVEVKADVV